MTCSEESWQRRDFLRVGSLGFLGITLEQYLRAKSMMAAVPGAAASKAKAQACILLWLEGGPSQVDTWDPKRNSLFRPISTNVSGIQVSELLPRVSKKMDKLSIIRSMFTEENNHPQAIYYAFTGHRPNPAMEFPSFSSVIAKEMGARNAVPAYVMTNNRTFGKAAFLGAQYDPLVVPDPSAKDFKLPDLSLPKGMTMERLEDRRALLNFVDQQYRAKSKIAEQRTGDL